jgi:hypothetical protein
MLETLLLGFAVLVLIGANILLRTSSRNAP